MNIKEISDEIFYSEGDLTKVTQREIDFLKEKASVAKHQRSRLCAHVDIKDPIHEMLIIHYNNTYVRPHKHIGKSESVHLIEGASNIVVFNDRGDIKDIISMGERESGNVFYYRMKENLYHTVVIKSDVIVFHETTKGPFNKEDTIFAPWSPVESDQKGVDEFMNKIKKQCDDFIKLSKG